MTGRTHGFLIWNPFQMVQFKNLAERLPNSKYLLLDRAGNLKEFDRQALQKSNPPVEIIPAKRSTVLDGCFDVIFFQTPFPGIENFKKSKLVSIQYGLAKERHNYGEWRSLADMNLMYGDYSAAATSHYAPSYSVGNVKFAGWDFEAMKAERSAIEARMGLDGNKKTVLYMPTYGDLGSFADLLHPLSALRETYNVIIKMHHNNERRGADWMTEARSKGLTHLMTGGADQQQLLAVADLVVSDFSGAIFDGLYAKIPILLYQARADEVIGVQKFSHSSIEFRRRDEIGLVCMNDKDFPKYIEMAIKDGQNLIKNADNIRRDLFIDGRNTDTIGLIEKHLSDLHEGLVPKLSQPQLCVREAVQSLRRAQVKLNSAKNKDNIFSYFLKYFAFSRK